MQILKILNPEDVNEQDLSGWTLREAARAVVLDEQGRIGLLHVQKHGYYKLPGGGIEPGESTEQALAREVEEELGVSIEVTGEVGIVIEYRAKWKLCQTSYCFTARVTAYTAGPAFTKHEQAKGFKPVWVAPAEARLFLGRRQTTNYEGRFIEARDDCLLRHALTD